MTDGYLPAKLSVYSNLILSIMDDNDFDPLWLRFYQLQMGMYLLSKKNLEFHLHEAQHAYDLIAEAWTDLKTYIEKPIFPIADIDNIFKGVCIDFPTDEYTISDTDNNDELVYGSF